MTVANDSLFSRQFEWDIVELVDEVTKELYSVMVGPN